MSLILTLDFDFVVTSFGLSVSSYRNIRFFSGEILWRMVVAVLYPYHGIFYSMKSGFAAFAVGTAPPKLLLANR